MTLQVEYERPHQRNEPESLQTNIINCVRYIIKSMYPEKIIRSMIDEHVKKFVPYSGECEYKLDYRNIDKNQPCGVATIYLPPENTNNKKKN